MNVLAIDPAKKEDRIGHALFIKSVLIKAGKGLLYGTDLRTFFGYGGAIVVIEKPRWYAANNRVDVNDLIDLSERVGEIKAYYTGLCLTVEGVWPREWKGTVPDDVMQRRILSKLTSKERDVVPLRPRKLDVDHNVSDAIGIGLHYLRR